MLSLCRILMKLAFNEREVGSAEHLITNRRVNDVLAIDSRDRVAMLNLEVGYLRRQCRKECRAIWRSYSVGSMSTAG